MLGRDRRTAGDAGLRREVAEISSSGFPWGSRRPGRPGLTGEVVLLLSEASAFAPDWAGPCTQEVLSDR